MFALLAYLFVCSLLIFTFHLLLFLSSRISFILRRKGQIGKVEVTSIPPQMSLQVSLYLSLIVLTVIIIMITVRGFSHCDHCTDSLITVHPHCNHCTDSVITVTATPFMIIVITTLLRLPYHSLFHSDTVFYHTIHMWSMPVVNMVGSAHFSLVCNSAVNDEHPSSSRELENEHPSSFRELEYEHPSSSREL